MLKLIHVIALVASLFDHSHAHPHHVDHDIDMILGNVNARRAIARS